METRTDRPGNDPVGETFETPNRSSKVAQAAEAWAEFLGDEEFDADEFDDEMAVMRAVQVVGGSIIAIAIITVVVNAVLTTSTINNSTGPFTAVIDSLNSTGVAAMTLLVVGLLAFAGFKIMNIFGGGGL